MKESKRPYQAASWKNGGKEISKAVALRYVQEQQEAPIVTAKGKGLVAQKIIERAQASGVPVQENASLVEVLSKLDIDQQIPPELYQLVAEVLSFVYRMDQRVRRTEA
ncbi:EscU/YscU/HrcU family type III secretion system export apparatus switch protein [Ferviditalea candida]|uniref:EscU/YscU/HrcU family type III secretion system export apparatus switch protein n=1 Tax=Ferviditalea candida TaxID=3108399 RepID=A0ABU5ZFB0_9BACL|nr:EscU/YscU/HrcU family type III secretion system export apparatus switch protein [Paenibacillaceae bacterium T2]